MSLLGSFHDLFDVCSSQHGHLYSRPASDEPYFIVLMPGDVSTMTNNHCDGSWEMKNNLERLSQTQKIEKNDASSCFVVVNKKNPGISCQDERSGERWQSFFVKKWLSIFFLFILSETRNSIKATNKQKLPPRKRKIKMAAYAGKCLAGKGPG